MKTLLRVLVACLILGAGVAQAAPYSLVCNGKDPTDLKIDVTLNVSYDPAVRANLAYFLDKTHYVPMDAPISLGRVRVTSRLGGNTDVFDEVYYFTKRLEQGNSVLVGYSINSLGHVSTVTVHTQDPDKPFAWFRSWFPYGAVTGVCK